MRAIGRVSRVADAIGRLGLGLSMVAIAATVLLILAEIVLRAAFATSLLIVEEVVGYLVSLAVMTALAGAFREGEMIRVTALPAMLRPGAARALEIASLALALAATLFLARYVLRSAWRFVERGTTSNGVVPVPLWLPEAAALLGLALLAAVLALSLVERVAAPPVAPPRTAG